MNPTGPIPEVAVRPHRRLWTAVVVLVLLSLCPTVHSQQGGAALNNAGWRGGRFDVRPLLVEDSR
jgi:hypothetical protein